MAGKRQSLMLVAAAGGKYTRHRKSRPSYLSSGRVDADSMLTSWLEDVSSLPSCHSVS